MPPHAPPITGWLFHSASVTVRPKPSFDRLLEHDDGRTLKRVDDAVRIGRQQQHLQVVVVAGLFHHFAKHLGAFGIVVGRAAGQGELQRRVVRLEQAIGLDHAQRILEAIEARHLDEQRPFGIDAELRQRLEPFGFGHRAVLVRQRIDRRRHEEHRARQRAGEGGHREHRRRVVRNGPSRCFQTPRAGREASMWQRQIQRPT